MVLVLCVWGGGESVCMCVCLFTTLSETSVVSMLKMRYTEVCLRLFLVFNLWIFNKSYRSEVMP